MENNRGGFSPNLGGSSKGTPGVGQSSMESLIYTLIIFMQQQRSSGSSQGATKALKGVVDKIGKFDGKDITGFLKAYICEMEVHQVPGNTMMESFALAVVPEIHNKVQELCGQVASWARFEKRFRDEYFDEDTEWMTRRSIFEWEEQQSRKLMDPNEVL